MGKIYIGKDTFLNKKDLTTHTFICGSTGSGKTVTGKILIEESLLNGIPVLAFDLKGDVFSMAFPLDFYTQERFNEFKFGNLNEYYKHLEEFGYSKEKVEELKKNSKVRLYSPLGINGISLGFSPIPLKPQEKELISEARSFAASNILELSEENKNKDYTLEKAYLEELIEYLWDKGEELSGIDGLEKLIAAIKNPPISKVGVNDVEEDMPEKKRNALASKINAAALVSNKDLFEGVNANDIDSMIGSGASLNIIDLSTIQDLNMQAQIIGMIGYSVFRWMKKKGESSNPRLLIFIDEIGGGGGYTAFLPSDPYNPPSKSALRILLKQGRAFGVSMVLSTQSPGDVDYKSLSNCLTWFVGKLNRQRDRDKVLESVSSSFERDSREVGEEITALSNSDMILIRKDKISRVHHRWLLTPHKTLSDKEKKVIFEYLKEKGEFGEKKEGQESSNKKVISQSSKNREKGKNSNSSQTGNLPSHFPEDHEQTKSQISISKKEDSDVQKYINDKFENIKILSEKVLQDLNQNFEEDIQVINSLKELLKDTYELNPKIISQLDYLNDLDKFELLATFDGHFERKKLLSSKVYKAKKLSDVLEEDLNTFQKMMQNLEDKFSYFGKKENRNVKLEFVRFLDNLRERLSNRSKASRNELKNMIVESIYKFFEDFLDYYKEKIEETEKSLREKHDENEREIEEKLQTAKDIHESVSEKITKFFRIYKDLQNQSLISKT